MTEAEIEKLAEKAGLIAGANHSRGMNCAEAVLSAVLSLGLSPLPNECVMLASGLGGGIGRSGNLCGAINGGALGISAAAGRVLFDDDKRDKAAVREDLVKEGGVYYRCGCYMDDVNRAFSGLTDCAEIKKAAGDTLRPEAERHSLSCAELVKTCAGLAVINILK